MSATFQHVADRRERREPRSAGAPARRLRHRHRRRRAARAGDRERRAARAGSDRRSTPTAMPQALAHGLRPAQGESRDRAAAAAGAREVGEAAPGGIRGGSRRLSDARRAARRVPGAAPCAAARRARRGGSWPPSSSREEVQQRELIRAAFRRYISPKLADQILANPELRDSMFSGNAGARARSRDVRRHARLHRDLRAADTRPKSSSC